MSDEFESVRVGADNVKPRSGLSLRARAVGLLSRREHSRVELARKLSTHAQSPEELNALLDALAKEGWQSDERFVQGFVHRKAGKQGLVKIAKNSLNKALKLRRSLKCVLNSKILSLSAGKMFGKKNLGAVARH